MTSKRQEPHIAALLIAELRKLPPTGGGGFEGLIARLLSAFTGRTFRLAAAGSQGGQDLSAYQPGEFVVSVECKRFGKKREFEKADLVYKITQACDQNRLLDLWVLAASRQVSTQLQLELNRIADRLGVYVGFLDHDPHGLGPLPVLCASLPEITLTALSADMDSPLAQVLEAIRHEPQFQIVRHGLSRELDPIHLGYAAARNELQRRFIVALGDPSASREEFGQRLLPLADDTNSLPRAAVNERLDSWWGSWPSQGPILALVGEEGTGKSWNLACWVLRRIEVNGDAPLILWCSSREFEFHKLVDLGADLLERLLPPGPSKAQLTTRVSRWGSVTQQPGAPPRVLFVIDGVNERPQLDKWRHWLVAARQKLSEHLPGAALILTCRSTTWAGLRSALLDDEDITGLLTPGRVVSSEGRLRNPVVEIEVQDFNDLELEQMIASCHLSPSPLQPELRKLLHRPRYFQLARRHWASYERSGDFTVARLFFEEWRSREQMQLNRPLSDQEFQGLLSTVARDYRDQALSRPTLANLLSGSPEVAAALGELISAGVFVPAEGAPAGYHLETNRLYLGLGIRLIKSISSAKTLEEAMEVAAAELEAASGTDDASRIVAHAACIALTSVGDFAPPQHAVLALLLTLVRQRNAADAWEKAQAWMYYPVARTVFQSLAEEEWSRERRDYRARERISFAFAWIAEKWPADVELASVCRRWLCFVHTEAMPATMRARQKKDAESLIRARIATVSCVPEAHEITPLLVGSANLVNLADLALLILCEVFLNNASRELFLPALAAWAVRNAVLGWTRDHLQAFWVARIGGEQLWPLLTTFADFLQNRGEPLLSTAAAEMLRLEGSTISWKRADQLDPQNAHSTAGLDSDKSLRNLHRLEPSRAATFLGARALDPNQPLERLHWRYDDLLKTIDLVEVSTGSQRTRSDLTLEEADAALCRTAPRAYSNFARRVINFILMNVVTRADILTDHLLKNFLLLSHRHFSWVQAALKDLEHGSRADTERASDWDLVEVLLGSLDSATEQLKLLLSRPNPVDDSDWDRLLAPLPKPVVRAMFRRLPRATGVERRRQLWFPWKETLTLTPRDRGELTAAASDSEVDDNIAGLVPQHARDPELLLTAVRKGWIDDEWLSRILANESWARAALAVAPKDFSSDIGPQAASWLVYERGLIPTEVHLWVREYDSLLRRPPRGPLSAGGKIAPDTVDAALRFCPGVTDSWVQALADKTDLFTRLANAHHSLVSALLLALMNLDDTRAEKAFGRLLHPQAVFFRVTDSESGGLSFGLLPFKSLDTPTARRSARLLFDQAFTDDDLQQLSFAAARYNRLDSFADWLSESVITSPGNSLSETRVLALLALAPASARAETAIARFAANPSGWRSDVAAWARAKQQQDVWTRHWFRRFLEDRTKVGAWAAFRLFLHGVDRRFFLWCKTELHRVARKRSCEIRRRHLLLNLDMVNSRIKKQAERMAGDLCGHVVPSNTVPWKTSWRL